MCGCSHRAVAAASRQRERLAQADSRANLRSSLLKYMLCYAAAAAVPSSDAPSPAVPVLLEALRIERSRARSLERRLEALQRSCSTSSTEETYPKRAQAEAAARVSGTETPSLSTASAVRSEAPVPHGPMRVCLVHLLDGPGGYDAVVASARNQRGSAHVVLDELASEPRRKQVPSGKLPLPNYRTGLPDGRSAPLRRLPRLRRSRRRQTSRWRQCTALEAGRHSRLWAVCEEDRKSTR